MKRIALIPLLVGAMVAIRHISMKDPRLQGRLHLLLGQDAFDDGLMDRAIAHLQKAVDLQPNVAQAHRFLGEAFLQSTHTEEAVDHLISALVLDPQCENAQLALAAATAMMTLQESGQMPEA